SLTSTGATTPTSRPRASGCAPPCRAAARRARGPSPIPWPVWARLSSSWRPMRRCCRTSSSGWRGGPRWAWASWGGEGENFSGDLMIAFSTANPGAAEPRIVTLTMYPNQWMDALFGATIQATEEAIVNAMLAADTMTGADSIRVFALPQDRLLDILRRYNRLAAN